MDDPKTVFFIFNIIAIMSLLMQGENSQSAQAASPIIAEGKFLIIWGDGVVGSGETRVAYYLSANQNDNIQLIIREDLLSSMGGSIRFNQKAVKVRGIWQNVGESIRVQTIALAKGEHAGLEGIYGPQPWVSILCKFSDKSDEPNDLNYFRQMYSSAYPGLDHFWRQNSYGLANLEGSNAYGWYTLPHDRAYYLPGGNFDWWAAAADCTGVADDDIEFTPYVGINLMFNYTLDCCAWGGGWYACLDGFARCGA